MSKYKDMEKVNERLVETNKYVDFIKDLNKDGYVASLIVTGNSMYPFLKHKRDVVYLNKIDSLDRGDIVLYQRKTGQFVLHRLVDIKDNLFYFRGDAQSFIEGPLEKEQLIACVSYVKRKGKMIYRKTFKWKMYYYITRCYLFLRGRFK